MKAKTVSPFKKKAVSTAKNKTVSPTKKKVVTTAKKKAVSPSKKIATSTKMKKIDISYQAIHDIVARDFKGKRIAYFVLETERSENGAFLLCVALEGIAGFSTMDWGWHCTFAKARVRAKEMNELLGLTPEEVVEIVISTMKPPIHQ